MSSRNPRWQRNRNPRREGGRRQNPSAGGGKLAKPSILFEDAEVVVLAKPAGLATANVPRGQESLLTWLRDTLRGRGRSDVDASDGGFLGVVSRLDQPVSGVVVVTRTRQAAASLSAQFRERTVSKTYHALVEGRFPGPAGATLTWSDLLERPAEDGPGGRLSPSSPQEAVVDVTLIARGVEVSLVKLLPKTGRRHQLRVQLGSRNCPIVGDRLYGSRLPFPCGIALHSSELRFDHPATGQPLVFRAPWPASWQRVARGLPLPPQGLPG